MAARQMPPALLRMARTVTMRRGAPLSVFKSYGLEPFKQTVDQGNELVFTDHEAIFEGKATSDLLRALLVLRLCAVGPFVQNSEGLLAAARRALGDQAAYKLVRESFFKHFCAGKEPADVWARMNALRAHGIGAILDYAEEEDLLRHCGQAQPGGSGHSPSDAALAGGDTGSAAAAAAAAAVTARQPLGGESLIESRVAARTYDYQDEAACERHVTAFLAAIDTAATLPGQPFAAIKLSALGDPQLLEHLSYALSSVRGLFGQYDTDGDGFVSRQEFEECFERLARAQGGASTADERSTLWRQLDEDGSGRIDYISWAERLDLRALPAFAAALERQAAAGPGGGSRPWHLSLEEQQQLEALFGRLERLVDRAVDKGVKLMVDAEQSVLRPAIDHIALSLMRKHNSPPAPSASASASGAAPGEAVILLTYQAYLRDVRQRLEADLARAARQGYTLGAKLVRGAYLHLERRRAAESGQASPVWDHIEETNAAFDDCLATLAGAVKGGRAELMVGSHNQGSVEATVAHMSRLGLDPSEAPVYFGQLLGMADNLSFTLGHHGYKVFKYCPYGSVDKVIPYLLRRVNENQYVMKGGKQDVKLLWEELWRRALHDPAHSPLARALAALRGGGGATASA